MHEIVCAAETVKAMWAPFATVIAAIIGGLVTLAVHNSQARQRLLADQRLRLRELAYVAIREVAVAAHEGGNVLYRLLTSEPLRLRFVKGVTDPEQVKRAQADADASALQVRLAFAKAAVHLPPELLEPFIKLTAAFGHASLEIPKEAARGTAGNPAELLFAYGTAADDWQASARVWQTTEWNSVQAGPT